MQRISVIAFGLRVTILIYIISPLNSYIHNVLSLKTSHGSLLFQEINKWHPNLRTTYKISDFLAFSLQDQNSMMFSKKDQTFGDLFQAYIYRYKFLRVLELIDTYANSNCYRFPWPAQESIDFNPFRTSRRSNLQGVINFFNYSMLDKTNKL